MATPVPRLLGAVLCLAVAVAAACGSDDGAESGAGGPDDGRAADLDGTITVYAAASLTDALTEVAGAFEATHAGVTVELNFAGSSALREQILAGAPADVFASATPDSMDQVVTAGAVDGEPRVLARNTLEIAVPAGNPGDVEGLADFADDDLLIGLCAVEVPCGELGREVLARAGVTPSPDTDEPDVRSLLTKVAAGDLDAGIVYHSDVVAAGDDVEGIAIPDAGNVVADHPVAALSDAGEPAVAAAFVDFLLAEDGQAVLESHGFLRP
jgi:molybdate transport system substrate-binding protein